MDPIQKKVTDSRLATLAKAFDNLRLLDREVPGQVVSAFLYIASHDGCHQQAVLEELGLETASSSRVTDWLSDYHRLGKPGMGLITKTTDPTNRRRKILRLTPKGEELAQVFKDAMA